MISVIMDLGKWLIFVAVGIGSIRVAPCQCASVDFVFPSSACINEKLKPSDNSVSGTYRWDFCTGEFNNAPKARALVTLPGVNGRPAIEFAKDGDKWFGFATGTNSNILYRLEFGNGPSQPPTLTENLGTLSGRLDGPSQIRIINENGLWYGFVINTPRNEILKLEFGDKLSNPCTASVLINNIGSVNAGLALGKDPIHGWTCVISSQALNNFSIVRLGNNLVAPAAADIISSASVSNPNNLGDIDLVYVCGSWIGFADNLGNGNIYRLEFGSSLFSAPVITQIVSIPAVNPGRLRIVKDGEDFFLLVVDLAGTVTKLRFGTDFLSPPDVVQEGSIGGILPANVYGIGVAKDNSNWAVHVINASNGSVYQIDYLDNCPAVPKTSTVPKPEVRFGAAGAYHVTLEKESSTGVNTKSKLIQISTNESPDIEFTTQNICVNRDVDFFTESTSTSIADYFWEFGDTNSSTQKNPLHSYLSIGTYQVTLRIVASNGCNNYTEKMIEIYEQPVSSFSIPLGIICTNREFIFTNTTPDNFDGNLTYQWFIGQNSVSNQRDLKLSFTNGGSKEIKLVAAIPGCSSEFVQTIRNVGEGPVVNFDISGKCVGEPISFNNQSTGDIAGYEWSLGTTASTELSPTISFPSAGSYNTSLKATGTNGCISEITKPLVIYSKPTPNFSLALPPFSCSGSPSQFTDTTPALTDSNLAAWAWSFGAGSAVSTQQNPTFTYTQAGSYNVELTVTSDQGCAGTIQNPITILQSPTVDFTNGPACRNQATQFTASTTASIKSYQWTIGANTYTVANPTHVFGVPGVNNVQLRVVAQNDCVASISKTIQVPVELIPNFSVANACAGQTITLTNITSTPNDPVRAIQWLINNQPRQGSPVSQQFANPGTYPVRLQLTGESGCSYVLNRDLVIHPTPRAAFTISDDAGPPPFRVAFTNNSQGANTYVWRFNDGSGGSSTSTNPEFTFNALGTYGVDLVAFNAFNCSDQITQQVRVVTPLPDLEMLDYRVVQDPATKLWVNQIDIKNNSNYTILETPLLLNLGVGITFRELVREEWRPGVVRTVTLQNQLQSNQPLSFACAELALPGDLQPANNKICVALGESTIWLAPYPNPANQFITVPLISQTNEPVTIRLIHATGAVAYEKVVDRGEAGLREWTLSVASLANGIYTLVVQTKDGERTSRVLINR
jgi:PKD repeat protein